MSSFSTKAQVICLITVSMLVSNWVYAEGLGDDKQKLKSAEATAEEAQTKTQENAPKDEAARSEKTPSKVKAQTAQKKTVVKKTKKMAKKSAVQNEPDQWGPWKYYLSMSLDDVLEPEVEENLVMWWVLAAAIPVVISGSAFFLPFLIPKFLGDPGPGFYGDVMVSLGAGWAVGTIVELVLVLMLFSGICTPVGYVGLLAWGVFSGAYWRPVIMINMYNRSLQRKKKGTPHPLSDHDYELPWSGDDEEASARDILNEPRFGSHLPSHTPAMSY